MAFKWLGCCLLLGFSGAYCFCVWRKMYLDGKRLRGWIALLVHVRGQISCFGTPLHNILVSSESGMLEAAGIERTDRYDFACLCREAGAQLPGKSGELIRALGDEIGTIWRQEQLERLDYYIEALSREEASYASGLSDKMRLRTVLTMCAALGVILLVW